MLIPKEILTMNETEQSGNIEYTLKGRRIPIRRRVHIAVLITTVIAIAAAIAASLISMNLIKNESEDALISQLEQNLSGIVREKASNTDTRLEHYEAYIDFLTDYIEIMYEGRELLIGMGQEVYQPLASTPEGEYAMQLGYAREDTDRAVARNDMYFFSNLEKVWQPIAMENDGLINTLYVGTDSGLLVSYDKWSYLSVPPEGEDFLYDFFDSEWYKQGIKEDGIFYTGLYTDSQGRGLTITVASPFRDTDGVIRGVDCADFDITGLYDEMLSMDLGKGSFSFAIGQDGSIISPDAESIDINDYTGLDDEQLAGIMSDKQGILETADAFYAYTPIERVGWTLCACVPKDVVLASVKNVDRTIWRSMALFILGAILIIAVIIAVTNRLAGSITHPMELLDKDMEAIAGGDLEHRATAYRNDEIGDMTIELNNMVDRLKATLTELDDTRIHAEEMTALANKDALTGIRNKTAYDNEVKKTEWEVMQGNTEFGFAMIDLNFLKKINDTFGHDKGNISIKKLCHLVCVTFAHSPVFRIGGDEFAVILKGDDYHNVDELVEKFNETLQDYANDDSLEPWEQVSAAIGYALYNKKIDSSVDNVFKRADAAMYECKKNMKALRE